MIKEILEELKKEGTTEKKTAAYAQDLLPDFDISSGMYIINSKPRKRYLKVIEISATNFQCKEPSEQRNIISTFSSWIRLSPEKCQLKIMTETDFSVPFLDNLTEKLAGCEDPKKEKFYEANIGLIRQITENNTCRTRYFLIIEYDYSARESGRESSEKNIATRLNETAIQAREYFSSMGNSFIRHDDEDIFLGEFLYRMLNRKTSQHLTFRERARRVLSDVRMLDKEKNMYPKTDYANIVCPPGISQKSFPGTIICDETYFAYYYVTSDGYPLEVSSGWLTDIFSGLPGVDMDLFYRKLNKKNFMGMLVQVKKLTRLKAGSRSNESTDAEDIITAYGSQQYMQEALSGRNNPQDPYNVVTLITVHAETKEQLKERCEYVEERAKINMLKLSDMKRYPWEGFKASLPFNDIPRRIYAKAKRNVTTDGLAGFYPFTAYELNDPNGLFIGMNLQSRTLVTFDPYNTEKYPNANMVIFGGSGAGKTFSMALLAERNVLMGNQVFIITSSKSHEFRRMCDGLGGKFVRYGLANGQYVNRFDIRPESDMRGRIFEDTDGESWLTEKLKSLSAWYELLFRNLTEEELIVLDRATKEAYASIGITEENNSIYEGGNPENPVKKMPVITDVIRELEKINEDIRTPVPQRLFTMLYNFTNGTYAGFNERTNISLDTDLIVFDISNVSERIEPATIQSALDFAWSKIKEDPTASKTLIIEEGWKYLSKGASDAAAKQIQEIFKVIRGYGGSVVLGTQEIGDILASEYGKSLIACSSTKLLLGVEEGQSMHLAETFHLQEAEAMKLESYTQGAGLFLAGKDHIEIKVMASDFEEQQITTDKHRLADIYRKKQKV